MIEIMQKLESLARYINQLKKIDTVLERIDQLEEELEQEREEWSSERILPLNEVLKILDISYETFNNWRKAGKISYVKIGRKVFVTGQQLQQCMEDNAIERLPDRGNVLQ